MNCMFAALKLHLRMLDDERQAKGLPRLSRTPWGGRRLELQPARPIAIEAGSPTVVARAP